MSETVEIVEMEARHEAQKHAGSHYFQQMSEVGAKVRNGFASCLITDGKQIDNGVGADGGRYYCALLKRIPVQRLAGRRATNEPPLQAHVQDSVINAVKTEKMLPCNVVRPMKRARRMAVGLGWAE